MTNLLGLTSGRTKSVAGKYEATAFLSSGRFADVFRAYDNRARVDVALKIYRENGRDKTEDIVKREHALLKRLAQAASPFFPEPGLLLSTRINGVRHWFVAMELARYAPDQAGSRDVSVPHETADAVPQRDIICLQDILPGAGEEPETSIRECDAFWEPPALYDWVVDLCEAVRLLHKNDVLHLDLKPENILLKRPAGTQRSVPFIVDFNTSLETPADRFIGGTAAYRTPEVEAGSRNTPAPADDLWAIAKVLWSLFHGLKAEVGESVPLHPLVLEDIPALRSVLLNALAADPTARYQDADALAEAVHDALAGSIRDAVTTPAVLPDGERAVSVDDLAWVRSRLSNLRETAASHLAGDETLYVAKDVRDEVDFIYLCLSDEQTETIDLATELSTLGAKALPALVEGAYKLAVSSPEFSELAKAAARLAATAPDISKRTISTFCLSSNFAVRQMCRRLCEELGAFPIEILDSLVEDHGVYLPKERVDLADMCVRLSAGADTMMSLTKYMCREYLCDPSGPMYKDLKTRIAARFAELRCDDKPRFLVEEVQNHIWSELPEYQALSAEQQEDLARGMLQLFGDAFASLRAEAHHHLVHGRVPEYDKSGQLRIAFTFAVKLAYFHPPTKDWIAELASRDPSPFNTRLAEKVGVLTDTDRESPEAMARAFDVYMASGDRSGLNRLVYTRVPDAVFQLFETALRQRRSPHVVKRTLDFLVTCKGKHRSHVLHIAFDYWEQFSDQKYGDLVKVVASSGVPPWARTRATELFEGDLKNSERTAQAADALDKIFHQ